MIFHLPILSRPDFGIFRAPGPGLGNLLFPIARAVIGQKRHGGEFVMPTMRQIKIGTFLRRERDKRTYGDIFSHRDCRELARWIRAQGVRATCESEDPGEGRGVIHYKGLGGQFHDLVGYAAAIGAFLRQRSSIPVSSERADVAIHVRLGDFGPAQAEATEQNIRIPLDWYREALARVRQELGNRNLRGVVFTDADPEQVITELGIEGFSPEPPGNALTSLLALGNADALIGSRSTFSLWGRYFGDGVAIWPQGFDLQRYAPIDANRDIFV